MSKNEKTVDDLGLTQELFEFLQGELPEGYRIEASRIPKLTPDQAWTVVWYLGSLYWQVKDFIERCDICGDLFNSNSEGDCLDYGDTPYHFCDYCMNSDVWYEKAKQNPDESLRPHDD